MKQNIFPAYKNVIDRVKGKWKLCYFPLPKFTIKCPVCGSEDIQARNWQFVYRDVGGHKYRCNVSFKCTVCSFVFTFGLVIPEKLYKMHLDTVGSKIYHWREVKKWFDEMVQKYGSVDNIPEV